MQICMSIKCCAVVGADRKPHDGAGSFPLPRRSRARSGADLFRVDRASDAAQPRADAVASTRACRVPGGPGDRRGALGRGVRRGVIQRVAEHSVAVAADLLEHEAASDTSPCNGRMARRTLLHFDTALAPGTCGTQTSCFSGGACDARNSPPAAPVGAGNVLPEHLRRRPRRHDRQPCSFGDQLTTRFCACDLRKLRSYVDIYMAIVPSSTLRGRVWRSLTVAIDTTYAVRNAS